ILVVNKIDKIKKDELLTILSLSNQFEGKFLEIIPISALHTDGINILLETLIDKLPYGPKYFPEDMYTDQPEIFLVGELIREKIFNLTREEIPYKTAVKVEEFKENIKKNIIRISATVFVERKNHKGIIIGKNGEMLKKIGSEARVEIERILASRIFLELWVKVKENWTQSDVQIKEFGYGN
nr:GTPase Era [Candidatus Dadabacteria bacterium]NIQ16659.1 GTPase Era [Candidatus Dadabacteria bacterium]